MKSALSLLSFCLIALTTNACAMGRARQSCDPTPIPARPLIDVCLGNADGSAECIDSTTGKGYKLPSLLNMFCTHPKQYIAQEEWIKSVLSACGK